MDITLQEVYDGFAETYEENRGLFDMTEIESIDYRNIGNEIFLWVTVSKPTIGTENR